LDFTDTLEELNQIRKSTANNKAPFIHHKPDICTQRMSHAVGNDNRRAFFGNAL
jgi:hypothetical protein